MTSRNVRMHMSEADTSIWLVVGMVALEASSSLTPVVSYIIHGGSREVIIAAEDLR